MTEVGDILRCVINMLWDGTTEMINVYHFQVGRAGDSYADTLSALRGYFDDLYGTIRTEMSNKLDFLTLDVENMTQDEEVGVIPLTVANGAQVGEHLPTGIAAVVLAHTQRFRSIAKKFLPGITENLCNGDTWIAATLTALAAFADAYLTGFDDVGASLYIPVIYNDTHGYFAYFTDVVVNGIPGYQRRRKAGVGS